jgi:RNA polymerase sigma-70 factor (ECF subfamily)
MTASSRTLAEHAAATSDAALIEESLRCPDRFGELYDRYFGEIYRYVAGRLDRDVADDLAADTFLVAFRRRARFDAARGPARAWLYGIATNLVGQHRRDEARRYRTLARVPAAPGVDREDERVAEQVSARGLRGPLMLALARLPAGDRDVLLLVSLAGLSYDEVAVALSIPPGTVGSRLNRARRKVRETLGGANPLRDDTTGDEKR